MNRRIFIFLFIATTAAIAALWTETIPLGIPGEWEWSRHAAPADVAELLNRALPCSLSAVILLTVSVWGARTLRSLGRVRLGMLYLLLLCAGSYWLHQVQQSAPQLHRTLKPLWVLYDGSSSGYFYEAVFEIESTTSFLETYEDRMREGEVLHVGTHPPGLFLLSRWCLLACESSPRLCQALNAIAATDVQENFRTLETAARFNRPLTENELAALQLLSLLTSCATALTMIPLAVVCSVFGSRRDSWRIATLWFTLPCLAVFLPKSDLLFPLTATTALMFALLGFRTTGPRRIVCAVCCGGVLWIGLTMSLAHIPVIFVMCGMAACRVVTRQSVRPQIVVLGTAFLTVATACLVWLAITDCNLFVIWKLNLQNHEGFYGEYTRTWWKWTLTNPLELALAVGPVVGLGALSGGIRALRLITAAEARREGSRRAQFAELTVSAAATWALLWLSGKNQGEAARLWCFLTPWLLFAIAAERRDSFSHDQYREWWPYLLALQLLYAICVVSRVNGFSV